MPAQPSMAELVPILQTAIGPALLISGVGLLLLTMINRLNHVVDRARSLVAQMSDCPAEARERKSAQLAILWQRAILIRRAIICASASALSAALLVIALFLSALFQVEDAWLIGILFINAMGALIVSLLLFMRDIERSLAALEFEMRGSNEALGRAVGPGCQPKVLLSSDGNQSPPARH